MSDLSEAIERLTQSNEACGGSGSPYPQLPSGSYSLDIIAVCDAAADCLRIRAELRKWRDNLIDFDYVTDVKARVHRIDEILNPNRGD